MLHTTSLTRLFTLMLALLFCLCLLCSAGAEAQLPPEADAIRLDPEKTVMLEGPDWDEPSMAAIYVGYVIDPALGVVEVAFREDGTLFEPTAFLAYLRSCCFVSSREVASADEAMLYLAAKFASTLSTGLPEEDIHYYQYLLGRQYTARGWAYEDLEEQYSFRYGDSCRLVLYGDPLSRAELHVSEPGGRFTCVLPLETGYTQHTLYEAAAQPEMTRLPAPAVTVAYQQPMLAALEQVAADDAQYAASGGYALQQFGLFAACLHAGQPMEQVLELADAFPALQQANAVTDESTVSWYAGRSGSHYLRLFCTFEDDGLSQVGFAINPETLDGLLAEGIHSLPLFGVDETAASATAEPPPLYTPVVYLAIADEPAAY